MPRMKILDKSSFNTFRKPPEFTSLERKYCFDISNKVMNFVLKLRSPCNQIGFILNS